MLGPNAAPHAKALYAPPDINHFGGNHAGYAQAMEQHFRGDMQQLHIDVMNKPREFQAVLNNSHDLRDYLGTANPAGERQRLSLSTGRRIPPAFAPAALAQAATNIYKETGAQRALDRLESMLQSKPVGPHDQKNFNASVEAAANELATNMYRIPGEYNKAKARRIIDHCHKHAAHNASEASARPHQHRRQQQWHEQWQQQNGGGNFGASGFQPPTGNMGTTGGDGDFLSHQHRINHLRQRGLQDGDLALIKKGLDGILDALKMGNIPLARQRVRDFNQVYGEVCGKVATSPLGLIKIQSLAEAIGGDLQSKGNARNLFNALRQSNWQPHNLHSLAADIERVAAQEGNSVNFHMEMMGFNNYYGPGSNITMDAATLTQFKHLAAMIRNQVPMPPPYDIPPPYSPYDSPQPYSSYAGPGTSAPEQTAPAPEAGDPTKYAVPSFAGEKMRMAETSDLKAFVHNLKQNGFDSKKLAELGKTITGYLSTDLSNGDKLKAFNDKYGNIFHNGTSKRVVEEEVP